MPDHKKADVYLAKGEAMARERAKKERAYQQQHKQQRGVAYADAPEVEYYEQYEEERAYDQGYSNGQPSNEQYGNGGSGYYTGQDDHEAYNGDEEAKGSGYTNGHGHAPGHDNQSTTPVPMTRQGTQRAPSTARAQAGLASPPSSPPFAAQEAPADPAFTQQAQAGVSAQQTPPTSNLFPACFVQLPPNNRWVGSY